MMNRLATILTFVFLAMPRLLGAAQREVPRHEYRCGLGEPGFVLACLTADFFVARKEWPLRIGDLKNHAEKLAAEEKAETGAVDRFLAQFAVLEFSAKGRNLALRYRLRADASGALMVKAIFSPGDSVEKIVQAAKEEESDK